MPGAKRRMLEEREREAKHEATKETNLAGYCHTRNEYLRQRERILYKVHEVFSENPVIPDDYMAAKGAAGELMVAIDEKATELEAVMRAIEREKEMIRSGVAARLKGGAIGHEELKAHYYAQSMHRARLLRLEQSEWRTREEMQRDEARLAILHDRSKGAWVYLRSRIRLADRICDTINDTLPNYPSTWLYSQLCAMEKK